MSVGGEWYARDNTLVSLGFFYTDVDSYTFTDIGQDPTAPDSDGVVRNGAQTQDIAQGEGASYYGFEFGYQATFDFLPGFLQYTGVNLNYTFTPSQAGRNAETGEKIILANGDDAPFNGTAENQVNLILFYQDSKFQARVAANYLSEQYLGTFSHWSFTSPNAGLPQWQDDTLYIDASASYDLNDNFQVFVQGANLTEESPKSYVQWSGAHLNWTQFERVITVGARAKF
jgi:iron complex outermembrane recepter protein